MDHDELLLSLIATQNLILQGIHAELRALRLERRGSLSEGETMELEAMSVSADMAAEVIGIFDMDEAPGGASA